MKHALVVSLLLAFTAQSATAAPSLYQKLFGQKETVEKPRPKTEMQIGVSPSLLVISGKIAYPYYIKGGTAAGVDVQLTGKFFKPSNIQLSLEIIPGVFTVVSAPFFVISLAGAIYEFQIPGSSIRPFAGLSMGLAFGNFTNLALFARPGMNIALSETLDLTLEARLGSVGPFFTFMPQAGLKFSI